MATSNQTTNLHGESVVSETENMKVFYRKKNQYDTLTLQVTHWSVYSCFVLIHDQIGLYSQNIRRL